MKKTMTAGFLAMWAGFSLAATPLLQQDFNKEDGSSSLVDRATGVKWRTKNALIVKDDCSPSGKGGCAGSVKNSSEGKQYYEGDAVGTLQSMTVGGWIKVGQPTYMLGQILNNQLTEAKQGFGLNVSSNNFEIMLCVNAKIKLTGVCIAPNTWTFVAVTYDGTRAKGNVSVYVATDLDNLALANTVSLDQKAVEGSPNKIKAGLFFSTGLLDNLRLYGSATDDTGVLREDEIKVWMKSSDVESKSIILGACFPSDFSFAGYKSGI